MKRLPLAVLLSAACLAGCTSKDRFTGGAPATPVPAVGEVTNTAATVLWSTDDPAAGSVQFGTSQNYSQAVTGAAGQTVHKITLTNLAPSTVYHYRVHSLDNRGNTVYSYDDTFQTRAAGPAPLGDDFEGSAAWTAQTYTDSQAVTAVAQSMAEAHGGASSLALTVNLVANDPADHLTKGETFVAFSQLSSDAATGFADLNGLTMSAWIYAPTGASGDPMRPNGIQPFVKDAFGRSQYGPWTNISENAWFQVSMTVGGGGNAHTDPGFDPTIVALGGIKLGGGGGSAAVYNGPVYLDDVVWRP